MRMLLLAVPLACNHRQACRLLGFYTKWKVMMSISFVVRKWPRNMFNLLTELFSCASEGAECATFTIFFTGSFYIFKEHLSNDTVAVHKLIYPLKVVVCRNRMFYNIYKMRFLEKELTI